MPNSRSAGDIEFYQSRILRIFSSGGRRKRGNENYFLPISLDLALTTLYNKSYLYLKQISDDDGKDLDKWVGEALSRSLPFLQGIKGDFGSFTDFRKAMFDREILYHLGVNRHRLIMRQEGKHKQVNRFPSEEERKRNLEGFQPPLLNREGVNSLVDLFANEEFLTGLKNPTKILRGDMFSSWEPNYFSRRSPHKQRALNLWLQNPSFEYVQIANILKKEGLGEFPSATIRGWVKRALDSGAVLSLE